MKGKCMIIQLGDTWYNTNLIEAFNSPRRDFAEERVLRICVGGKWTQVPDPDQEWFKKLKDAMDPPPYELLECS